MSQVLSASQHSILKNSGGRQDQNHTGEKIHRRVSFETIDIAPITELYRDFMNNTRQRDVNAYHKLTNPYYLAPSFNKPFLNYDFKTANYSKKATANTFLVLLKLNVPDEHHHHHHHRQTSVVDELSIQTLIYTINRLAKDCDEIFILSVISKFDFEYQGKGFYLADSERQKFKSMLDNDLVPLLKSRVVEALPNFDKNFSISLNLVFDQNVTLSIQTAIIDFSPNMVILSHHEDDEESSRKPRFLQFISNSNSITNYCMKKLNIPIIIFTENTIKPYRIPNDSSFLISRSIDEELATKTTPEPTISNTISSIPESQEDYYVNLIKSVPTNTIPESRSASRSRSRIRSGNTTPDGIGSRSSSLLRSRSRSAARKNRSLSPSSPSATSSTNNTLLGGYLLSPFRSSDIQPSLRSNDFSTLAPHKSADAAFLQKAKGSEKSSSKSKLANSSIKEEDGNDDIREKLKKSFPTFSKFKNKLSKS